MGAAAAAAVPPSAGRRVLSQAFPPGQRQHGGRGPGRRRRR